MTTIEDGARLFRYESRGWTLKPQQILVGDCLDRRAPVSAIEMPRRTAKTESVLLWVFAMMEAMPGIQVAFTMATTRDAARKKFMADVVPILEPLVDARDDMRLWRGAGYEGVQLGPSMFSVVAPNDRAFRSKKFDIIIVDEAGAADPDIVESLLSAALPTMDTSELGMLVLMGTAGEYRAGNLLYDALHDPGTATVRYGAGDLIELQRMTDWDYVEAMLNEHHPGVGTLTTTERLRRNLSLLGPEKFAREYFNLWGDKGNAAGIFKSDEWHSLALEGPLPLPPKRFAIAVAATEDYASIVAAWREHGEGRVLLLDHRAGRTWLPVAAKDLAKRYRVPVVIDPRASTVMADVVQRIEQLRPAPRVERQDYEDVAAAHERIVEEIKGGRVRHWNQEELTSAFLTVRRQQMGGRWKFGRPDESADITAAQAATLALRYFDQLPSASIARIGPVAV